METPVPLPRSVYSEKLRGFSDLAFSDQAAFQFRGRWGDFFRQRMGSGFNGRVVLEVGCFDVGFLSKIAMKHPTTAFVGLDWKCKAIYDGAQRVAALNLKNIALLRARGSDLLKIFGEVEVNEIWVFHPEVSKGKEVRLIGEPFLLDAHRILRDSSSLLSFKTDHPDYYQWMLGFFDNANPSASIRGRFNLMMKSSNFWEDPAALAHAAPRDFAGEVTFYENRFIKKRRPIHYIEMRKK